MTGSSLRRFDAPSLIQGISQQSPQSTKQASAKDQENCINDLLLGCRARNGSTFKNLWSGLRQNAFFHRIERSEEEDYLVMVTDGVLEVINLADGQKASISGDISSYLAVSGSARASFSAATVEDQTFIANSEVTPAMSSSTSAARSNWAFAHFKSANYSVEYKLHIKIGETTYTATYETPNNSSSDNALYIATNRLAASFTDAINALGISGLTATRYGSTILIDGGSNDFTVSSEDGLGGDQFITFKERVKELADLPISSVNGYKVAVGTDNSDRKYDYYLEYQGSEQGGKWVEIVAPGTVTGFDTGTMPQLLTLTGVNSFTVGAAPWGSRLSGDGEDTSKDPEFVGKSIVDIQFVDSRLAIITESSFDLSRARNAFVFFPDTAQTTLDTDPVSSIIANGKSTIVRGSVVVGKRLQLWANKIQTQISSGDEAIAEDTVENLPMSSYQYDGRTAPSPQGLSSLIFGSGRGRWNDLFEIIFRGDTPIGEINLTGHCAKLIDGNLNGIDAGNSSSRIVNVWTDSDDRRLYIYQWYNDGDKRVQSAWNYWTFTGITEILWAGMTGSTVYLLISWGSSGHSLETVETEYEGDEYGLTPLRADHRINEDYVIEDGDGYRLVQTPYEIASGDRSNYVAYQRVTDSGTGEQRGIEMDLEWVESNKVKILSDIPSVRFYLGARVVARRKLPKLFLEDRSGASIITEKLHIMKLTVSHTNSAYYRCELEYEGSSDEPSEEFTARLLGDPDYKNEEIALQESGSQSFKVRKDADAVEITLINDSIFPSSWEALKYHYIPRLEAQ
jgi:hypothetical protein